MMTREEIALRMFCALMSRPDAKIDLYPDLGEKQIQTCFRMADNFRRLGSTLPRHWGPATDEVDPMPQPTETT